MQDVSLSIDHYSRDITTSSDFVTPHSTSKQTVTPLSCNIKDHFLSNDMLALTKCGWQVLAIQFM